MITVTIVAETKKLALKTEVTNKLPVGMGDEQRLTQVLLNLGGSDTDAHWLSCVPLSLGSQVGTRLLSCLDVRRYTLTIDKSTIDKSTIEKRFGGRFYIAEASYDYEPTYNAAPSQMLPIMRTHKPDTIELAKWGFWPKEWKRSKHLRAMINARLETAAEKPMFARSFQTRHCMILADGYYEWRTTPDGRKQPYRITLKTGEPFAMAGIYAREATGFETAEKNPVNFAILTTKANEAVSYIHERMPVILQLGSEKGWLTSNTPGPFFMPEFPPDLLTSYPVTPK
jgi:putative SOS response-associated peptidase YedK